MNVVDSSGWLEFFSDGPNADFFATPIEATTELLVPTIAMYEVFKYVSRQRGDGPALQAMALLRQGTVVDLTDDLAMFAASISLEKQLPMADSIMLATAYRNRATLWTQDSDFRGLPGVEFRPKRAR